GDPVNGPFKSPIPIAFLKVRAGVKFCFLFQLHNNPRLGINPMKKLDLIQNIILAFGMGAKTAVGYGQFVTKEHPKTAVDQVASHPTNPTITVDPVATRQQTTSQIPPPPPPGPKDYQFKDLNRAARQGGHILGKVVGNQNRKITFEYLYEGQLTQGQIPYGTSQKIEVGRRIKAKVKDAGNPKKKIAPRFGFGGYDD
ncbi:MAG: hypothetical protein AAF399_26560, partial [Bacteroidota bacterium]